MDAKGIDPRDRITPDVFTVDPDLRGAPPATPKRRAAALLLDLTLASILAEIGGFLIGVLFLAAMAPPSPAQLVRQTTLRFVHLTAEDGLSDHIAQALLQDRHGFIWIGTLGGLNRYDGYGFTSYNHDPQDANSLPDDGIFDLLEARDGALWVASITGVTRYDPVTESFTRFAGDGPDALPKDLYLDLLEDGSGHIWAASESHGLFRIDPTTGAATAVPTDPEEPSSPDHLDVRGLVEAHDGAVWFGLRRGGVRRFDPATGRVTRHLEEAGTHHRLRPRLAEAGGALWVAGWGLYRFDPATGTAAHYLPDPALPTPTTLASPNAVLRLLQDRRGRIWGSTNKGVIRFDPATGALAHILPDPADPTSLSNEVCYDLLEDRSGMLWIGTDEGVDRLDPRWERVTRLSVSTRPEIGGSVAEDANGALWISFGGGALRFDRRTGTATTYRSNHAGLGSTEIGSNVYTTPSDPDYVWIAHINSALDRLDVRTGAVRSYRFVQTSPDSRHGVGDLYQVPTQPGVYWAGVWDHGLCRLEGATGATSCMQPDPADPGSLPSRACCTFAPDPDAPGILWVGTGAGLSRFDTATETFTHHYRSDPADTTSLSVDSFGDIHASKHEPGVLWVGTWGGGLNRFDRTTGRVTRRYTEQKSELPGNYVSLLVEDALGMLWIGTVEGVARLDPRAGTLRNMTTTLGMRVHYVTDGLASRTGELIFRLSQDLYLFDPEDVAPNPTPPAVVLTGLRLFDATVRPGPASPLPRPLAYTEALTLSYAQRDVTFDYVALDYVRSEEIRYAYRLEGYDETWREAGTRRLATYMNLPPGAYTFRVKAANSDGVWNEDGASVQLTILPPWWRTWWAYLLYGLLGVGLVYGVTRWRVAHLEARTRTLEAKVAERTAEVERQNTLLEQQKSRLQTQAEQLLELDAAKSRFFANISHEFRTPLTLILGPIQDALDDAYGPVGARLKQQLHLMQRNSSRLLRLINQLLDLSRLETGGLALRARRADLLPLLKNVVFAFASQAERKDVMLRLDVPPDPLYVYFEPDKLEKIVVNLLSNALKFTPEGGRVDVVCRRVEDEPEGSPAAAHAEIVVRDTGPGIPAEAIPHLFDRFYQVDGSATRAHEGTGIGLALTQELVALHGGAIRVESEPGHGAAFFVRLPLGTAHLAPEHLADDEDDGFAQHLAPIGLDAASPDPALPEPEDAPPVDAPVILIVEDHDDVRAYLKGHLAPRYRVEEAIDGAEGLEKARATRPDLVISDVMMPRMDGYALCAALKTDADLGHIPVILLTAKAREEDKVEGLETGADDYIYKPFNRDVLLARVENLIEIRRLLRRRFSREVVAVEAGAVVVVPADAAFLEQATAVVEAHLTHTNFGVDWLADEVGMSLRQLQRKLKDLTGLSPSGFIRTIRLQRAAQLLEQGAGTVSEVAYAVGFNDPKHFSKLFRQIFGVAPSQYPPREG